jgi:hypothetical protein
MSDPTAGEQRVPTVRIAPPPSDVLENLGLLQFLVGEWEGEGFNLVARPDFEQQTNLFLELNRTKEFLKFDPISSSIPNRGVVNDDIELFGLTYLQRISDADTGGALHIEPGIWVTQPTTLQPPEEAPGGAQIVARMASVPHGNAILAEGTISSFTGPPILSPGPNTTSGANPAFSIFPSFNSTPFTPATPAIIAAAGTSEAASAPPAAHGGFSEYTLTNPAQLTPPPANTRTPLGNVPPVPVIPGVITQELVNDPIIFLQQRIQDRVDEGHTFKGVVINIATQAAVEFQTVVNSQPGGPTVSVPVTLGGGAIGNIPFLQTNAATALVYATFWVSEVSHPLRKHTFLQLSYAQMVILPRDANSR